MSIVIILRFFSIIKEACHASIIYSYHLPLLVTTVADALTKRGYMYSLISS